MLLTVSFTEQKFLNEAQLINYFFHELCLWCYIDWFSNIKLLPRINSIWSWLIVLLCLPCASASKESACKTGDLSLISGLGKSPGERNSYPLQDSGWEKSMDCIVHMVTKSQTWLSDFHFGYCPFEIIDLFSSLIFFFLTVSMSIFRGNKVKVKVAQLCPTLWPHGL